MNANVRDRSTVTDRRTLLKGVAVGAAAGMVATPLVAHAESKTPADVQAVVGAPSTTPAEIEALGGTTMSLYELNERRHAYVDAQTEWVCADGTVIPEVYVKLRALFNTYSIGVGSESNDECFKLFMRKYAEDEAQAVLEMPYGCWFTAIDYAWESGRSEQECLEICEDLASRCLLGRARRSGVPHFHQLAVIHGLFEYGVNGYFDKGFYDDFVPFMASDFTTGLVNSGTPFLYAVPVDQSVVSDPQVIEIDDVQKMVDRNPLIAVAPCQCATLAMARDGLDRPPAVGTEELKTFTTDCGHPLEACMIFGEQAEYYVENGLGRMVDQDEAREIVARNIDAGLVPQPSFTKDVFNLCWCHSDHCLVLKQYQALGADVLPTTEAYPHMSNYLLDYDKDACIGCGACVERCPMKAVSMGEDGVPQTNGLCIRCGQCGLVCPAAARTLHVKPREEILERRDDIVGIYNQLGAYRFEHGTIY